MNTIVIILIAVAGIYLLMKVALYIYRPFYLTKVVRDIQTKYEKLLMILNNEIEAEAENLQKWVAGDHITRLVYHDESELQDRFATANEAKLHEQKNYDKFVRTRERFLGNYKKLAEAIVLYRRYLDIKFRQDQMAAAFSRGGASDAMSFEERFSIANEMKIAIEECERKLDLLLES